MGNNQRTWIRLIAFGLSLVTILATFFTVQVNPLAVAITYLALLGLVIAIGLATNFTFGLLASAASVFVIVATNQYLGIYHRESLFINISLELTAILLVGPLAGGLAQAIRRIQTQADHWLAQVDEHAVHDESLGTLKPEWAILRLEEEVLRAQRFSRPLSLVLLHLDPNADRSRTGAAITRAERIATLQAITRLARVASPSPTVVAHVGGGQVLLILPEYTTDQAETVAADLRQRAEKEVYFPGNGDKGIGAPLHQWGRLKTVIASLDEKTGTAEQFLSRAKADLETMRV